MGIDTEVKKEIRLLQSNGKLEEALRKLIKLRMQCSGYDCLEDELFLNYNLAWHYSRDTETIGICKHYLSLIENIFQNKQNIFDREEEYYKWLWLNTEVYKEEILYDEYCKRFGMIAFHYEKIGNERFHLGALENIVIRTNNTEQMIEFIKDTMDKIGFDNSLVNDMVSDYKKVNYHAYIGAKKLINLCLEMNKDII